MVEAGEEKHQLKSAPAKLRLPGWKTFIAQLQCKVSHPGRGNNKKFSLPGRGKRYLRQNILEIPLNFSRGSSFLYSTCLSVGQLMNLCCSEVGTFDKRGL